MASLNQVECDSGCYKLVTEIEVADDWHNLGLHVQVKNGSLNSTVRSGSEFLRGCKEDVNIQFPTKNKEVKDQAGKAGIHLGGEPVLKAIKFSFFECNEYLCNSALNIVPGILILLPFVLLTFNLFTI